MFPRARSPCTRHPSSRPGTGRVFGKSLLKEGSPQSVVLVTLTLLFPSLPHKPRPIPEGSAQFTFPLKTVPIQARSVNTHSPGANLCHSWAGALRDAKPGDDLQRRSSCQPDTPGDTSVHSQTLYTPALASSSPPQVPVVFGPLTPGYSLRCPHVHMLTASDLPLRSLQTPGSLSCGSS